MLQKVSGFDIHEKTKVCSLLEILELWMNFVGHVFLPLIKSVNLELIGSDIKNCWNLHATTDIPYQSLGVFQNAIY